jgi:probable HAF family extracellular repeat protein
MFVTALSIALLPPVALAETRYTIVDLGTLGGNTSRAFALNDANPVQVVGQAELESGARHAFLWRSGQMKDLGTFSDCSESSAFDINDAGKVVGEGRGTQVQSIGCWRAFLWTPGAAEQPGTMTPLNGPDPTSDPGWFDGCYVTSAQAINNSDVIVGNGSILTTINNHKTCSQQTAIRWTNPSARTPLGSHDAYAITSAGWVGGTHPTEPGSYRAGRWSPAGEPNTMDTGSVNTIGRDLNEEMHLVGSTTSAPDAATRAYMWDGDTATNLGALPSPYDCRSAANAINSTDQIVGWSSYMNNPGPPFVVCDGSDTHAFLYEDGSMLDLNDLVPNNTGWVLREATDINNRGQIVGVGTLNGKSHGFLLNFAANELLGLFALDAPAVGEGQSFAKFTVKRSDDEGTSDVKFTTKNDTAKSDKDYKAKSGKLTFDPGTKKKTVKVKILNDQKSEGTEKFFLSLSKPGNAQITDKKAKATIKDND